MWEEREQVAWREIRKISHKRERDGGECVAVEEVGQRLFYLEGLEAHLNSACVSPALAECYLL